jgi:peptidoglycan/LPS O-acetylase OafA/YrhL
MTERVASIDGLRGILAALVLATHFLAATGHTSGREISLACVLGFFVLSGYVLTRGWRGNYVSFLVRRFVRLWPTYALCIAVGGCLIRHSAPAGVYFWFPFLPFERQPRQDPVVWSLYIEVWFMPFMPVLASLARRPLAAWAVAVTLMVTARAGGDFFFGAFFVIGAALADHKLATRGLEGPVPQWLGRVSYSLYLSHTLVIWGLQLLTPAYWSWFAVPASFVVAEMLARFVEAPSIALSRRVGHFVERLGEERPRMASA